ncbi:hypothetical protein PVK06_041549 [Gossypium arboreum]|uniref:Uncharacterized protein n=1 Tax=Gossypium arboreum TaxID=29729 RepID=A0ABR0NAP2_GOSAR|nr:hypothetical protein PVK06_041549 [Gossypium arboreum]
MGAACLWNRNIPSVEEADALAVVQAGGNRVAHLLAKEGFLLIPEARCSVDEGGVGGDSGDCGGRRTKYVQNHRTGPAMQGKSARAEDAS